MVGGARVLEELRQEREAEEQRPEVEQRVLSLELEMAEQARSVLEHLLGGPSEARGEEGGVRRDHDGARQGHPERVVVEEGDAEQDQEEEQERERDPARDADPVVPERPREGEDERDGHGDRVEDRRERQSAGFGLGSDHASPARGSATGSGLVSSTDPTSQAGPSTDGSRSVARQRS